MQRVLSLIPYLIVILTLCTSIISYKFQIRPYIWVVVSSYPLYVVTCMLAAHHRRTPDELKILFLYVLAVFCMFLIQFTVNPLAIKSCFGLLWAPVFWIVFYHAMPNFDWERFSRYVIFLGAGLAIVGVVQRFVSLNLFGLIEDMKWSQHFESNRGQIRVTSLLDSPQVFGLFSAICVGLALNLKCRMNFLCRYLIVGTTCIGGGFSGNKSVSILIVLILFFRLKIPAKPLILIVTFLLLFVYGLLVPAGDFIEPDQNSKFFIIERSFQWIFDMPGLLVKEQAGRFQIYHDVISSSNVLWGHGMGSTAASYGYREINPESYILQIYSEVGLFPLMLILCFFIFAMRGARLSGDRARLLVIGLVLFSSFFVHAFIAPQMFAIWGIVIGGTFSNKMRFRPFYRGV